MLSKLVDRVMTPVVGYLLVLPGFAFLGLFVAALAMKSGFAGILGVAVAASFGLAVAAFRNGSATLATAREAGIIGDNASIWARPLRQEQIDGYQLNYRQARPKRVATVLGISQHAQKRENPSRCRLAYRHSKQSGVNTHERQSNYRWLRANDHREHARLQPRGAHRDRARAV